MKILIYGIRKEIIIEINVNKSGLLLNIRGFILPWKKTFLRHDLFS
jgi:hypothetical protein